MQNSFHHIRTTIATLGVLTLVLAVSATHLFADEAKRAASARAESVKERSAKAATSYATPLSGAVSTTMRALGSQRPQAGPKVSAKVNVGADTTRKENRVIFARAAADVFTARIEVALDEQLIEVGIYNMLGKKVMDVYKGSASRGIHDYTQPIPDLPEGVYICIMQGNDFRKAEKFFLSR